MKTGIQTWSSNGDIRPMIALADISYLTNAENAETYIRNRQGVSNVVDLIEKEMKFYD